MCNDYGNNIPFSEYLQAFSEIRIPVRFPVAAPNLQPRDEIGPTDTAPVICRTEEGENEFEQLRWGFPPAPGKGGAPVVNFRSENRRLPNGRCLIPVSHFYEFQGAKAPKAKYRFTSPTSHGFASPASGSRCPKAAPHSRC